MMLLLCLLLYSSVQFITDARFLPLKKRSAFYIANETACVVDGIVYYNGDHIPTDNPCELCKCRPPGFACVLHECEIKHGCKAIRREGECCPDYLCGCEHDGQLYRNGDEIKDPQNPCYKCHCQGNSIACAFAECVFRRDCMPVFHVGECCPYYNHCPKPTKSKIGVTSSPSDPITSVTESVLSSVKTAQELFTTQTANTLQDESVSLEEKVTTPGIRRDTEPPNLNEEGKQDNSTDPAKTGLEKPDVKLPDDEEIFDEDEDLKEGGAIRKPGESNPPNLQETITEDPSDTAVSDESLEERDQQQGVKVTSSEESSEEDEDEGKILPPLEKKSQQSSLGETSNSQKDESSEESSEEEEPPLTVEKRGESASGEKLKETTSVQLDDSDESKEEASDEERDVEDSSEEVSSEENENKVKTSQSKTTKLPPSDSQVSNAGPNQGNSLSIAENQPSNEITLSVNETTQNPQSSLSSEAVSTGDEQLLRESDVTSLLVETTVDPENLSSFTESTTLIQNFSQKSSTESEFKDDHIEETVPNTTPRSSEKSSSYTSPTSLQNKEVQTTEYVHSTDVTTENIVMELGTEAIVKEEITEGNDITKITTVEIELTETSSESESERKLLTGTTDKIDLSSTQVTEDTQSISKQIISETSTETSLVQETTESGVIKSSAITEKDLEESSFITETLITKSTVLDGETISLNKEGQATEMQTTNTVEQKQTTVIDEKTSTTDPGEQKQTTKIDEQKQTIEPDEQKPVTEINEQKWTEIAEEKTMTEINELKQTTQITEQKQTTETSEEQQTTITDEQKSTTERSEQKQTTEIDEQQQTTETNEEKQKQTPGIDEWQQTTKAITQEQTTELDIQKQTTEIYEEEQATETVFIVSTLTEERKSEPELASVNTISTLANVDITQHIDHTYETINSQYPNELTSKQQYSEHTTQGTKQPFTIHTDILSTEQIINNSTQLNQNNEHFKTASTLENGFSTVITEINANDEQTTNNNQPEQELTTEKHQEIEIFLTTNDKVKDEFTTEDNIDHEEDILTEQTESTEIEKELDIEVKTTSNIPLQDDVLKMKITGPTTSETENDVTGTVSETGSISSENVTGKSPESETTTVLTNSEPDH